MLLLKCLYTLLSYCEPALYLYRCLVYIRLAAWLYAWLPACLASYPAGGLATGLITWYDGWLVEGLRGYPSGPDSCLVSFSPMSPCLATWPAVHLLPAIFVPDCLAPCIMQAPTTATGACYSYAYFILMLLWTVY